MPIRLIDPADTPTYVEKPDIRFATTFISHEYRDFAVDGEAIMDKMTGELFIKRPEDGRVLSFEQNKKYAYDQMLELKILLTNDEDFTYPKYVTDAYYLNTNLAKILSQDGKKCEIEILTGRKGQFTLYCDTKEGTKELLITIGSWFGGKDESSIGIVG